MSIVNQEKAKTIYTHFTKAPMLEMVQYMVQENVDAQVLNQLKLIDKQCHKNAHVTSYAEKIYAIYERVCKILVTYPSLEFKNQSFCIRKNKYRLFNLEWMPSHHLSNNQLDRVVEIVNLALSNGVEWCDERIIDLIQEIEHPDAVPHVSVILQLVCGHDCQSYVQQLMKTSVHPF